MKSLKPVRQIKTHTFVDNESVNVYSHPELDVEFIAFSVFARLVNIGRTILHSNRKFVLDLEKKYRLIGQHAIRFAITLPNIAQFLRKIKRWSHNRIEQCMNELRGESARPIRKRSRSPSVEPPEFVPKKQETTFSRDLRDIKDAIRESERNIKSYFDADVRERALTLYMESDEFAQERNQLMEHLFEKNVPLIRANIEQKLRRERNQEKTIVNTMIDNFFD